VKRVLIRRDVGERGLAVADDGRRRVVARRLDSQKQHGENFVRDHALPLRVGISAR